MAKGRLLAENVSIPMTILFHTSRDSAQSRRPTCRLNANIRTQLQLTERCRQDETDTVKRSPSPSASQPAEGSIPRRRRSRWA
jgi:hypothetical protein